MNQPSQVESILHGALAKAPGDERSAYLDAACGGSLQLREEVNRLLAAHPQAVDFLEKPGFQEPSNHTAEFTPTREYAGNVIAGRYKLLEKIGEGGMGEVWVADQLEPIRRRVALKLIKPGMDSRAVLARFEAERQALALMDHSHIAKVLDAGTTAEHRPYFVMELVKGTPITEFCDARKLSPRERLELFIPVCQAIQHAHTKGIIHRDIKPSNVLVALHDERPVAKVIDFGVSKAIGQQLTEKTLYTGFGALVGTPTYMAPEQATFNQLDIDTRADVYALGVLLYELLAGSPPVEPERVKKAALDELLRVVREEDPPLPSQRLSSSESKASIAAVRQSDPERLSKLFRGELDWIVMKALEKDRNRRYETANGFAADIQRYLSGEQVHAVPPSINYRLRKFTWKNRFIFSVAGVVVVALLFASVVSLLFALKAHKAEQHADQRRIEAEKSAKTAYAAVEETLQQKFNGDIKALSLTIDLDLIEAQNDQKKGLLRFAHPIEDTSFVLWDKSTPLDNKVLHHELWADQSIDYESRAEFRRFREFRNCAALILGQEFAPLLPTISHDGARIIDFDHSPSGQIIVTLGADRTARLWDARTAKPLAKLLQTNELIFHCGFSPSGKTIFTDSLDGVVRIWNSDGTFRAQTAPRPERIKIDSPATFSVKQNQRLASQVVQLSDEYVLTSCLFANSQIHESNVREPYELWNAVSGEKILTLPQEQMNPKTARLLGEGRWLTIESGSTVEVRSAADGAVVAQLTHEPPPKSENLVSRAVAVSPSGLWLQTSAETRSSEHDRRVRLHFWDTRTWRQHPVAIDVPGAASFVTDDYLQGEVHEDGFGGLPQFFCKLGVSKPIFDVHAYATKLQIGGKTPLVLASIFSKTGATKVELFDLADRKRLAPPAGSPFHADVVAFSKSGRFLLSPLTDHLIDLKAKKSLFLDPEMEDLWLDLGEAGLLKVGYDPLGSLQISVVPLSSDFGGSPELLELWTQVTVRGQLNDLGEFVKWTEPDWEKKRQELAAIPPPIKDFPFPGYVATDKLHWLRAEYIEATDEAEKKRIAQELLRRAEISGDQSEAGRWRAFVTPPVEPATAPETK